MAKPGPNCLLLLPLLYQGFKHHFLTNISYYFIPRDLTTSPASSYKPYLKFSVNAILARGEEGEEEEEERKPLLRRNEEKEGLRSPSPSLSPQPPPYSSSSPPLSPIVTQVRGRCKIKKDKYETCYISVRPPSPFKMIYGGCQAEYEVVGTQNEFILVSF